MSPINKIVLFSILIYLIQFSSCKKNRVIELDESNWFNLLTDEWMVQFYAPWCPSCKNLKPIWEEFSNTDLIKIASIDVTKHPGLSGRFLISALPTIYHVQNGIFRQYTGNRDLNSLFSFIEEKKWKTINPISNWLHPSSYLMSIISWFFKVSMAIRDLHNRIVDDYGIPAWASYVLFCLATILFGAILGLILVCIIDVMILPIKSEELRKTKEKQNLENKKYNNDNLDDQDEPLIKDELEDDKDNLDDYEPKTHETKKSL